MKSLTFRLLILFCIIWVALWIITFIVVMQEMKKIKMPVASMAVWVIIFILTFGVAFPFCPTCNILRDEL